MMDALFGDTAHRLFAQAYPPDALRAVERGQAAPHHARMAVDQGAETAVADDAHLEVGSKHRFLLLAGRGRPPG